MIGTLSVCPRITSYNVCYTKLLRIQSVAIVHENTNFGNGVAEAEKNRITSYNVCYTKLLRTTEAISQGKAGENGTSAMPIPDTRHPMGSRTGNGLRSVRYPNSGWIPDEVRWSYNFV